MTAYVVRRLLSVPITIFVVTLMIFGVMSLLSPGERASLYVNDIPKQKGGLDRIIAKYGLNDPMPVQYARWVGEIARGNLGYSKTGKEPVAEMIRHRFPASVELALYASLIIIVVGIRLGIMAALRHNQWQDQSLRVFSVLGTSVPVFVIGLGLLMIFAAQLGWLPAGGRLTPQMQRVVDADSWHGVTGLYTIDALLNGNMQVFADAGRHLIAPVLALAVLNWAILLRVTRSSMLETLRQDYVRTARAKGLGESTVIQKHARPNAMLPVVTISGLLIVTLMGGAVITETIFNWPGLAQKVPAAAINLDFVAVLGLTMFFAVVLIIGNLIVDMLYAYIDPRVRLS